MSRRKKTAIAKKISTKVRNCAECGERFVATGRQKYCNKGNRKCRNKAYYAASKASKSMKRTQTRWVSVWTNQGEHVARLLGKSKTAKGLRYKVQVQGWEAPTWIDEKDLLGKIRGRKGKRKVIYTDPRRIPPEPESQS
jgi:hypothetical protein